MDYEKAKRIVVGCYTLSIRNDWNDGVGWRNDIIMQLYGSCIEAAEKDGRWYRDSKYPYNSISAYEYLIIKERYPDLFIYLEKLDEPQDNWSYMHHLVQDEFLRFPKYCEIITESKRLDLIESARNIRNNFEEEVCLLTKEGFEIGLDPLGHKHLM